MSYDLPRLNLADPMLRRIHDAFVGLFQGKTNNVSNFTVTPNAASTVITDPRCGETSAICFSPTSANASAEVGAGTIYISATAEGSFTVAHTNSATTGRTFRYVIVG